MGQDPDDDGYIWTDAGMARAKPGEPWFLIVPPHPGDGEFELEFGAWVTNGSHISVYLLDEGRFDIYLRDPGDPLVDPMNFQLDSEGANIAISYDNVGELYYIVVEVTEGGDPDEGATFEYYVSDFLIDDAVTKEVESVEGGGGPALWAAVIGAIVAIVAAIALVVWQERKKAQGRGPGPVDPTQGIPISSDEDR